MAKATATKKISKKAARSSTTVNKAQAIRDAAKEIGGKVRPKDVIAALAAKGINVSSPQVSATLKAAGYRRTRRRGSAGAKSQAAASNGISLENLLAAKALIARVGSVEAARKALEILAKLS